MFRSIYFYILLNKTNFLALYFCIGYKQIFTTNNKNKIKVTELGIQIPIRKNMLAIIGIFTLTLQKQ